MPSLIGTLPDQLPTNGDLGELAFQNKDSVEFYDGRGGLQHLALTAIKRNINVTAVDVFVYDTSKDSDGGAWRNRTQHTSWYNETLNTATRGARREFPAVAVIVAVNAAITIYDGDDPSLPMWMDIRRYSGAHSWSTCGLIPDAAGLTGVAAVNGVIAFSQSGDAKSVGWIKFVSDEAFAIPAQHWGYSKYAGTIADRELGKGFQISVSGSVFTAGLGNDVAMTVLPNAPIDVATGLPIPTIAVATAGGVSVINNNGTVENTDNADIVKVGFIRGDRLAYGHRGGIEYGGRAINVSPIRNSTIYGFYGNPTIPSLGLRAADAGNIFGVEDGYIYGIGGSNGVGGFKRIAEDEVSRNNGMANYIASKYNTGWMPGDIRGAWLSDTTQETVSASINLIANGTFDSGVSSWSGGPLSWDSGNQRAQITGTGLYGGISQTFSTIAGKCYYFEADVNCSTSDMDVRIQIAGIGSQDGSVNSNTNSGNKKIYGWFLATAESHTLQLIPYGVNFASTYYVDNVIMIEVQLDPSKGRGLRVFGSITKTPVAAGADLVAYSGFSTSNYLQQPYNSALDFGTNDFSITGWINVTSSSAIRIIYHRRPTASNINSIEIGLNTDGTLYFSTSDGNGTQTSTPLTGYVVPTGTWLHFCAVRRSSTLSLYVNGLILSSATGTVRDISNSSAVLNIGLYIGSAYPWNGSLALIRSSMTAPSDAQIKKMYEDEKYLFQDNAKATLYGTSDAVTALAYDEDTNLLHVGTSSGRSVFNGLRRVDNTTDAVGACISAAGGLVVED